MPNTLKPQTKLTSKIKTTHLTKIVGSQSVLVNILFFAKNFILLQFHKRGVFKNKILLESKLSTYHIVNTIRVGYGFNYVFSKVSYFFVCIFLINTLYFYWSKYLVFVFGPHTLFLFNYLKNTLVIVLVTVTPLIGLVSFYFYNNQHTYKNLILFIIEYFFNTFIYLKKLELNYIFKVIIFLLFNIFFNIMVADAKTTLSTILRKKLLFVTTAGMGFFNFILKLSKIFNFFSHILIILLIFIKKTTLYFLLLNCVAYLCFYGLLAKLYLK